MTRKCAAPECKRQFTLKRPTQLYCSSRCKNREAGRRLVKRSQLSGRKDKASLPDAKQFKEFLKSYERNRNPDPDNPWHDFLDSLLHNIAREHGFDVDEEDESK